MRENSATTIAELKKLKGVRDVAIGPLPWADGAGNAKFEENEVKNFSSLYVDNGFLPMMDIELRLGRNFDANRPADFENTIIVNEALVKKLAIENPIGLTIEISGSKKEIIGVMADFYMNGAVSMIKPIVLYPSKTNFSRFLIKIHPTEMAATFAGINKIWSEYDKRNYFKPEFLDDVYATRFSDIQRITFIINGVPVAIVGISLFGLFSLVVFHSAQRVKEIGIRKVLGASINQILLILSKPYALMIVLSTLVALPVGYYLMDEVLNTFPNRITLDGSFGIITVIAILVFSILVIFGRGLSASRANPVDILRSE